MYFNKQNINDLLKIVPKDTIFAINEQFKEKVLNND